MEVWFNTGEWINQGINIYFPPNHIGYPPLWAFWCGLANSLFYLSGNSYEIWRFIIKLPMILSNLALAYIVGKYAENRFSHQTARKITLIILSWSFFIYISAMWGQINAISALLIFLAFYAVTNQKSQLGAIFLGLAITLKIYPIVVLPAFFIYTLKNTNRKKTAKFLIYALSIPILFTLIVFTLYNWDITYFLRTIFYSTPVFESGISQFSIGNMNIWSFIALSGIDMNAFSIIRQIWIPILAGATYYWIRKPKLDEKNFTISIISFYILFMVSYGWIAEQTFIEPLPFIFLLILAYSPKRVYLYLLTIIQLLIYIFSVANQNLFILTPLLENFSPSLLTNLQNFHLANGLLIWVIRGIMGLVISLSLIGFLAVLMKPLILQQTKQRTQKFLKKIKHSTKTKDSIIIHKNNNNK